MKYDAFCVNTKILTFTTGYLSAVGYKIKIANYYFGSEKTDIEYTCNVSVFVQYIYIHLYTLYIYIHWFQKRTQ